MAYAYQDLYAVYTRIAYTFRITRYTLEILVCTSLLSAVPTRDFAYNVIGSPSSDTALYARIKMTAVYLYCVQQHQNRRLFRISRIFRDRTNPLDTFDDFELTVYAPSPAKTFSLPQPFKTPTYFHWLARHLVADRAVSVGWERHLSYRAIFL